MNITVKLRKNQKENSLVAFADIVVADALKICGIKLFVQKDKHNIQFPSYVHRRTGKTEYYINPVTKEAYDEINNLIFTTYEQKSARYTQNIAATEPQELEILNVAPYKRELTVAFANMKLGDMRLNALRLMRLPDGRNFLAMPSIGTYTTGSGKTIYLNPFFIVDRQLYKKASSMLIESYIQKLSAEHAEKEDDGAGERETGEEADSANTGTTV